MKKTNAFHITTKDNSYIESFSDKDGYDLAMLAPIEKENAETDMDSDASDDLRRGLLNSTYNLSLLDKGNKQKSVQRSQHANKKPRKTAERNWKKVTDVQPSLKLSESKCSTGRTERNNQVTY